MSFQIRSFNTQISDTRPYNHYHLPSSEAPKKCHNSFVVGGGCVGQGLAISLLKSNPNNRVFLVTKQKYAEEISKSGITTKGAIEETFFTNDKFRIIHKIDNRFFDEHMIKNPMIFSATKASDTVKSLEPFFNIANIKPTVVCLQNGLGSEKEVKSNLPPTKGTVLKGHVFGAVHKTNTDLFAYNPGL